MELSAQCRSSSRNRLGQRLLRERDNRFTWRSSPEAFLRHKSETLDRVSNLTSLRSTRRPARFGSWVFSLQARICIVASVKTIRQYVVAFRRLRRGPSLGENVAQNKRHQGTVSSAESFFDVAYTHSSCLELLMKTVMQYIQSIIRQILG